MHSTRTAARGSATLALAAALAILTAGALAWAQPAPPDGAPAPAAPAGDSGAPVPAQTGDGPAPGPAAGDGTAPAADGVDGGATTVPVSLRLRTLEQRVQALKERTWRTKARVSMLEEAVIGGGVGATASIVHKNTMGSSFRLIKLVYALDGTQVFARSDDRGTLHESRELEVLTGPIVPGSHTLTVLAIYRGHGYGVFKYLTKYTFTVRSSHVFTASKGQDTRIEVVAYEKGGLTTPLEDRPALELKVGHAEGATEK